MRSLFSPDSKIYALLSRLADLMLLNLAFILTCLPIFPIGAALTALYSVAFRMGTPEEGGTVREYFRAFKSNFRIGTVMWLILLAIFVVCGVDLAIAGSSEGFLKDIRFVFWIVILVAMFVSTYAFPLASRFDNKPLITLKNGLLLSIAYFPRSLVMLLVNLLPGIVLFISLEVFVAVAWFFIALYFAFAAWLNCRILNKVIEPLLDTSSKAET